MSRYKSAKSTTTDKSTNTTKEWESPNETSDATGLCRASVYKAIGAGEIEVRKFGRKTLVNVASRRAYMNSLPKAQIAPPKSAA